MLEKIVSVIKRHALFKIMLALCVGVLFCLNNYVTSEFRASSSLTLNYSQASQGKHLNGTRLNMNDLKDTTIMAEVIRKTGLQDLLTPDRLADMISITPRQSRSPESEYIATEYTVYLNMDEKIGGVSAHDLLQTVMLTYINSVYQQYVGNYAMLDFTVAQLSQLDYYMIGETLKTKADLLIEYMNLRSNEDGEFVSSQTGETFASLKQKIEELSSISLEKYNAYISNNGLTKQPDTYIAQLIYENIELKATYDKEVIQYETRVKAISDYPPSQSIAVLIPTVDASSSYYMSRTKTGVDYLSTQANEHMVSAAKTLKSITANEERLTNISRASNDADEVETAESMIAQFTLSLSSLENTVRETDNEYIRTKLYNSLLYYVSVPSDTARLNIKNTLIVMLLAFFFIVVLQAAVELLNNHRKAEVIR